MKCFETDLFMKSSFDLKFTIILVNTIFFLQINI